MVGRGFGATDARPDPTSSSAPAARAASAPGPWRNDWGGLPPGEWQAGCAGAGRAVPASRDLAAKRDAHAAERTRQPRSPVRAWDDDLPADGTAARPPAPARPARPIIPGERQFRDGDRVRHGRWGDGIVVTSKLTRSDEEVTVAFKDPAVGRKQMLVSLANLEIIG
jgi:hypothetical protein